MTGLEIIVWPLFILHLILAVTLSSVLLGGLEGAFTKHEMEEHFCRVVGGLFCSPDFWQSVAYCRTRYNILGEFDRNAKSREHMRS